MDQLLGEQYPSRLRYRDFLTVALILPDKHSFEDNWIYIHDPAVRVGRIQGNWVLNPTFQQLAYSDMELVVAGSQDSIVMVEGGALEVSEDDVVQALTVAQGGVRELIDMQKELLAKAGATPKMAWTKTEVPEAVSVRVKELAEGKIADAINGSTAWSSSS